MSGILERTRCIKINMLGMDAVDIFHLDCLNRYASELPRTTAPAGYVCPQCEKPIIPSESMTSPIAETIRKCLMHMDWAEQALPKTKDAIHVDTPRSLPTNGAWREGDSSENTIEGATGIYSNDRTEQMIPETISHYGGLAKSASRKPYRSDLRPAGLLVGTQGELEAEDEEKPRYPRPTLRHYLKNIRRHIRPIFFEYENGKRKPNFVKLFCFFVILLLGTWLIWSRMDYYNTHE